MLTDHSLRLTKLLRVITTALIILNVLSLLILPLILTELYQNPALIIQLDRPGAVSGPDIHLEPGYLSDLPAQSYPFYLGFLYACGIGTAIILLQGYQILRRIERGEAFCAAQAGSFRWLAGAFFWLAAVFLVKIVAYITLLTIFCCLLFCLLGLVGLILADVFRQAWLVKSENDMTI